MNDIRHMQAVSSWVKLLADSTRHRDGPVTKERVAAMVTLIAPDFPTKAFNTASLRYVAAECEWFPTYQEALRSLGRWWRDHAPTPVMLEGPKHPKQEREQLNAELAYDWDNPPAIRHSLATAQSGPMAEIMVKLLGAAVARHAPQHIHLIPPGAWPEWFVPSPAMEPPP